MQTAGLVEEDIPLLYREGGKTVHLTASKLMMRVGMIVEKALQVSAPAGALDVRARGGGD